MKKILTSLFIFSVISSVLACAQSLQPSPIAAGAGGGGGGGGATIPSTTNVICGDGAGNGADCGFAPTNVMTSVVEETNIGGTVSGHILTFRWLGALAAARMANAGVMTGDVVTTFPAVTISAAAITLAKMANLAANSFIGNNTGSPATPLALTVAQVKTLLALACGDLSNAAATCSSADAAGLTGTLNASRLPAALPSAITATTQSQNDNSTKLSTTAYTDTAVANAIAAVNPAVAVLAASTASVTGSYTHVAGVGDFFTVTATGAFTLDGIAINTIGQRVLLKDQSSGLQNGVYTATVVGAVAVSPVFTRALDYDAPSDINSTGAIPAQSGTVNALTSWLLTSSVTMVGTDALTYSRFSLNPANEVLAVSPGIGIAHFAGATQTATSSLIINTDIANTTIDLTAKVTGLLPSANLAAALSSQTSINGLGITASTGTLTVPNGITLNAGAGGTLGSNAFTSTAYAPLASPTFTGIVTIPTPFTLGAISVTSTGTQLNYLSGATGTAGTGNVVLDNTPTLITPVLGTATFTKLTTTSAAISFQVSANTSATINPINCNNGGSGGCYFSTVHSGGSNGYFGSEPTAGGNIFTGSVANAVVAGNGNNNQFQWGTNAIIRGGFFGNGHGYVGPGNTADPGANILWNVVGDTKHIHTVAGGTAPTIASGGGGTASAISGADGDGAVSVGTSISTNSIVVTFGQPYTNTPACIAQDTTTLGEGVQCAATLGGLASGTYTSGITATGTVGQTCSLTSFNGSGSGATATVALNGTNTIAGSTALVVTANGTGYTGSITSATAGNGTATCSGTATVSTVKNSVQMTLNGFAYSTGAAANFTASDNVTWLVGGH